MRVIIGGIGYRNLRDHSAGLMVAERLMERELGDDIVVEDLSYNPIAVVQRLDDEPRHRRFARAIFVGAVERGGVRAPGSITAYRWDRELPDAEEIQRAVADAVTGIINIDNTLIVAAHFGALPEQVFVVEIEPLVHEFGEAFSAAVEAAIEPACATVARLVSDGAFAASFVAAPLGGGPVKSARVE